MVSDAERRTPAAATSPAEAEGAAEIAQTPTTRRKSQPTARRSLPGVVNFLDRNSVSENVVVDIVSVSDESGDDGDSDKYEVEKILETKMEDGGQVFRVRWKNFGEQDDTWEPREALEEGCGDLLRAFLEAEQGKENAGTARRGRAPTKRTSVGPSQKRVSSASVPTAKRSRTTTVQANTTNEQAMEMATQLFAATPSSASPVLSRTSSRCRRRRG